uniref:Uncharacterized protein n=1 Tax=Lepeophtheirus salmonis TaxID=72036 RepID=A0A0K2T162_LEPSM
MIILLSSSVCVTVLIMISDNLPAVNPILSYNSMFVPNFLFNNNKYTYFFLLLSINKPFSWTIYHRHLSLLMNACHRSNFFFFCTKVDNYF